MAFSLSGFLSRISRPGLCALGPQLLEAEAQVRGYAARKGTREKALKKKRAIKLKKAAQAAAEERKMSKTVAAPDVKRTVVSNLPLIPTNVDVYFSECYRPKLHTIQEAIQSFKEDLHPNVLNSPKSKLLLFIELNMIAEKKTRTVNPWKKMMSYPHVFDSGVIRRILVLCKENEVSKARELGAHAAGGPLLIKQIKKGDFDLTSIDVVIGQVDVYAEINTIRSKLKLLFPRQTNGTLVADSLSAIQKFKYGVEYSCNVSRTENDFGWIETQIGTINMDPHQIEDNFSALLEDINLKKPKREGDFITHVWFTAPPSRLRLKIDFEKYLQSSEQPDEPKSSEEKTKTEGKKDTEEEKVSAVAA